MAQKRILIPTKSITDWQSLLAEPDKHWRTGYSAMLTAQSWENATGLPPEIASAFTSSGEHNFKNIELLLAIPEYKTPLKGGSRASQSDVFALLRSDSGLVAATVEGKAREDFGPTLEQWQMGVSDKGYRARLGHIIEILGLQAPIPGHIRYQLLHRTASAIIEAKRFYCKAAVMIVQSFVEQDADNHFEDFVQFVELYNAMPAKDELAYLATIDGIRLYSGWVYSAFRCKKQHS